MEKMCDECGRPNKRGGRLCAACYQRQYRNDPDKGPARRKAHQARVIAYTAAHPDKRREWVRNWRRRSVASPAGIPALHALRDAAKAIERASAEMGDATQRPGVGGTGQPGSDPDVERGD